MEKYRQKHPKIQNPCPEGAGKIDLELIKMSEEEEDIICRMHKLVGDNWALIAGRIPGRKAEEIERFWLTRNSDGLKGKKTEVKRRRHESCSDRI